MVIYFSKKPATYTPNTTVGFPAQVDGVEVTCEISAEALADQNCIPLLSSELSYPTTASP